MRRRTDMTMTAVYLLIISSGLLSLFFVLIIYTWFFRYFRELTTIKTKKRLEKMVSTYVEVSTIKGSIIIKDNIIRKVNTILLLREFVKNSTRRKEVLINIIIDYGDDFIESNHDLLMNLYEVTGIKQYLLKRLSSKRLFTKSLACRQLGGLKVKGTEGRIIKLIACKDNDVRYNVLLAVARLGDLKGLVYALTSDSEKINISYRAVIEIISAFDGSKEDLFEQSLKLSDDYIKGILIKAAANYNLEGLREYYLKYLKSDDKNLRIACIRALCELKNLPNEEYLINMLNDKAWEVRAASAKSLEKIGTSNSFPALEKAAGDSEWWVRHNAASTLVLLPGGKEYASKIINGKDNYAREAIVSVIEITAQSSLVGKSMKKETA